MFGVFLEIFFGNFDGTFLVFVEQKLSICGLPAYFGWLGGMLEAEISSS